MPSQKEQIVFQPSLCMCELLVSGRVYIKNTQVNAPSFGDCFHPNKRRLLRFANARTTSFDQMVSMCFFLLKTYVSGLVVEPTHLKNMRESNWIMKPQGSGHFLYFPLWTLENQKNRTIKGTFIGKKNLVVESGFFVFTNQWWHYFCRVNCLRGR